MVDIVIPTFNRRELLERSVNSVIHQTYQDWKLFIVDDGSCDQTELWSQGLSDPRIQYLKIPHSGVSVARNSGAKKGNADWIAFLDSDDYWLPRKLEVCLTNWDRKSPIIHTQEIWLRNNRPQKQPQKYRKKGGHLFTENIKHCAIGPSTVLIQRALWHTEGGFNPDLPVCEDQELWLRLCANHQVCLIDQELTIKTAGHADQLSVTPLIEEWRLKILLPHLSQPGLSSDTMEILLDTVEEKMKRLKRGYLKYNRPEKLLWLESIQRQLPNHHK